MPSRFESLSMVALEAWGLGRPVLANGRCDVLRGQTIRSRAGLYYDDFPEFAEALFTLTSNRPLHQAFGENGRRFYERHYAWPVIQRKYEDMLGQLSRANAAPAAVDALPGWLARRRRTLAPAQEIVDGIAKGPVAYDEPAVARGRAVARPVQQLRGSGAASVAGRGPAGRPQRAARPRPPRPRATVRIGPIARRAAAPASRARKLAEAARPAPAPREHRPRTGAGRRARGIARTAAEGRTGRAVNGGRRGGTDDRPGARRLDRCRRARGGRASRPSGAGDARLRRRHRPRGARHPEGAARRRLPLGHLRRDRRLAARGSDARLSRPDRRGDARDRPHPPLLDRIARLARRLRAAGADDPRLPQHHAAGVLRRRASAAGGAVLPRSARAGRLRVALRAGARRLRVQPPGAGRARLPAHRRPAGRPELRSSRRRARSHDGPGLRRRLDQPAVRRPGHPEQEDRERHPPLPRLQDAAQRAVAAAAGRLVGRVRALLRDAAEAGRGSRRARRPLPRPRLGRRARRLLRGRRPVPLRQRARGVLRAADGGVPRRPAGRRLRGHGDPGDDGRRRRPLHRQGSRARGGDRRRRDQRSRSRGADRRGAGRGAGAAAGPRLRRPGPRLRRAGAGDAAAAGAGRRLRLLGSLRLDPAAGGAAPIPPGRLRRAAAPVDSATGKTAPAAP